MRRLGFAILAFAVVFAALPATAAGPDVNKINKAASFCKKAERALAVENFSRAKSQFVKALEVVPSFPEAHIGLGQIAMREEDFAEALVQFEAARDGYVDLGDAMHSVQARRYAQAQDQINMLRDQLQQLDRYSGSPQSAVDATRIQNQIERLDAIEPPSDQSMREAPGEIYFYIGNALFQMGKVGEAVDAWQTCADRSPNFAMVHNNLAIAYWKGGDVERAIASLDRAEDLGFPVNPDFKRDLERSRR